MDIGTLAVLFFIAAFFDIVTVMVIKQGDQRSAPAIFRALATIYLDPTHPATFITRKTVGLITFGELVMAVAALGATVWIAASTWG